MPAGLLREWMQYEHLEPFGAWRDNFHSAMIATLIANANRDPKRRPQPLKMSEFFYIDPETARENEDMEFLTKLRVLRKH